MTIIKNPKCKCGGIMVCIDNHYICERYYNHVKMGIQEQQEMLEALTGGEEEEE
jgi:hypothetical protein